MWFRKSEMSQISIHPPRVGRDGMKLLVEAKMSVFQSTLPVWGGTWGRLSR